MKMIKREFELARLRAYRDKNLIKVITGVRRSGKSTLLELFRQELLKTGVKQKNIIAINFEDLANEQLLDYKKLHQYVLAHLQSGKNYVFFDEIQLVKNYEKVVDSLFLRGKIDLYLTGSNAYLLSGELATLLTGRYIELRIFPLSFSEYVTAFADHSRLDLLFEDYLTYGGFPEVANFLQNGQKAIISDYLLGIYNTILNKDIAARFAVTQTQTFSNIAKYLLDNIGNLTSPQNIADYLTAHDNKTTYNTVSKYLSALAAGLIFYPVGRQDVKGKQILQTLEKYYLVDTGLRRAILGSAKNQDLGHLLENVVYFELLRRGEIVHIGRQGGREIDFVARQPQTDEITYYQVAYSLTGEKTLQGELEPLKKIKDHYPKIILSLDVHETNLDGIKQLNVINWLLGEKK